MNTKGRIALGSIGALISTTAIIIQTYAITKGYRNKINIKKREKKFLEKFVKIAYTLGYAEASRKSFSSDDFKQSYIKVNEEILKDDSKLKYREKYQSDEETVSNLKKILITCDHFSEEKIFRYVKRINTYYLKGYSDGFSKIVQKSAPVEIQERMVTDEESEIQEFKNEQKKGKITSGIYISTGLIASCIALYASTACMAYQKKIYLLYPYN